MDETFSLLYPYAPEDPLETTKRTLQHPEKEEEIPDDRETTIKFAEGEELAKVVDYIVNREDISEEDQRTLWFRSSDYHAIKADLQLDSFEARDSSGLAKAIEEVYQEKTKKGAQEILNRWVSESSERRGLERLVNIELGNTRQTMQFQVVQEVLQAQDEMFLSKGKKIDAEELRKISIKNTKVPRHFARMMGKADAMAVGCDPCHQESNRHRQRRASAPDCTEAASESKKKSTGSSKDSTTKDKKSTKGGKGEKENPAKNPSFYKQFKMAKADIISRMPRIS